jgi:hypothetical protein
MDGQKRGRIEGRTDKWIKEKYIVANIVAFRKAFVKTSGKGTNLDET